MKIKNLMSDNVLTIREDTPFTEACRMFFQFKIHHLPVVNRVEELIGIVSSNDALKAYNEKIFNRILTYEESVNDIIKIGDIMSHEIYFLNVDDDVSKAILLFKEFNIHSTPVQEARKLVGILTTTDVINAIETVPE